MRRPSSSSSSPTTSRASSTTTRSSRDRLKVAFLPNYNVSLAEAIIPAADLSEQISTAGIEASGTGNMKLALNGALTIGTLDGANIEIRDHVGADNIFIFGLTAAGGGGAARQRRRPLEAIAASPRLAETLSSIAAGLFSPDDPRPLRCARRRIAARRSFMLTADFDAYFAAQRQVDALWRDRATWRRKSILNTARMAWFSSDRTIANTPRRSGASRRRREKKRDVGASSACRRHVFENDRRKRRQQLSARSTAGRGSASARPHRRRDCRCCCRHRSPRPC